MSSDQSCVYTTWDFNWRGKFDKVDTFRDCFSRFQLLSQRRAQLYQRCIKISARNSCCNFVFFLASWEHFLLRENEKFQPSVKIRFRDWIYYSLEDWNFLFKISLNLEQKGSDDETLNFPHIRNSVKWWKNHQELFVSSLKYKKTGSRNETRRNLYLSRKRTLAFVSRNTVWHQLLRGDEKFKRGPRKYLLKRPPRVAVEFFSHVSKGNVVLVNISPESKMQHS